MKEECWFCGKQTKCQWTILKYRRKHGTGRYCSKECAEADMWGPIFRKARILYIPLKDTKPSIIKVNP